MEDAHDFAQIYLLLFLECSRDCVNGGTCLDGGTNGHICKCTSDFLGDNCETSNYQILF